MSAAWEVLAGDWRSAANCLDMDTEVFFVSRGASAAPAKRICRACPVREACLAEALERREQFGIWGGLTSRQRLRVRHLLADGMSLRGAIAWMERYVCLLLGGGVMAYPVSSTDASHGPFRRVTRVDEHPESGLRGQGWKVEVLECGHFGHLVHPLLRPGKKRRCFSCLRATRKVQGKG